MADLKTKKNAGDVDAFIDGVENEQRREDCRKVVDMMKSITRAEPVLWGPSIIGFGEYHYKYASGRENDWFQTGLSPRKQNLSLYIMDGFAEYDELLAKLGKHRTGKSCLYINKLEDVDTDVLRTLITKSVEHVVRSGIISENM